MKKSSFALLCLLPLMLAACTFVPQLGVKEKTWLRKTAVSDLVYIEGNVKAYRSDGSYYYFKDGSLVKVTPSLLTADKL
jgi:starvation-inducible outer membrane lipoprotein